MAEYFTYNALPPKEDPAMTQPGPLAVDKETFEKMMKAKQENGPGYWTVMREVFAKDFAELPKQRFKVWASTMTVPFMARSRFIEYINVVTSWASVNQTVRDALIDTGVGMTADDYQLYRVFDDFPTTMNRVQHMAHLAINGWGPDELSKLDTIVELGGGIGDMADIVCKMGFKGKYIIYDFPEVGAIQKWYHDELGHDNIVHTSDLNDLVDADLCIATWSFTEIPLDLRDQVMEKIGNTKNWLIAYSNQIFGIDNDKYIRETFVPQIEEYSEISYTDIPFMPWDGGAKYLSAKYIEQTENIEHNEQGE